MPVYNLNGRVIGNTDMIGLNSDQLSIFLVRLINTLVSLSLSSLEEEPEVCKFRSERTWDVLQSGIGSEIWDEEEEDQCCGDCVRREKDIEERHFWRDGVRRIAARMATRTSSDEDFE